MSVRGWRGNSVCSSIVYNSAWYCTWQAMRNDIQYIHEFITRKTLPSSGLHFMSTQTMLPPKVLNAVTNQRIVSAQQIVSQPRRTSPPSKFTPNFWNARINTIRNWWPTRWKFLFYLFVPNQLYMSRAMFLPIIKSIWLYLQLLI